MAIGGIRGNVKWAWAKEATCQGALATRVERYEEAEKCFEQAIGLDPNHVRAFVGRGACYANQRKYAKAVEDFNVALRLDPTDARAASYKAAVEEKMEKIERVKESQSWAKGCVKEADVGDLDSLRARVLNPARGLETLRRGVDGKLYDLELGDDDVDNRSGGERRGEVKRKRHHKEKSRKKERRSDRSSRGRSSRKSSKKSSSKRSRRDDSSSLSSSSVSR
jgi:tetratricopeptide (TPR) repeat protein